MQKEVPEIKVVLAGDTGVRDKTTLTFIDQHIMTVEECKIISVEPLGELRFIVSCFTPTVDLSNSMSGISNDILTWSMSEKFRISLQEARAQSRCLIFIIAYVNLSKSNHLRQEEHSVLPTFAPKLSHKKLKKPFLDLARKLSGISSLLFVEEFATQPPPEFSLDEATRPATQLRLLSKQAVLFPRMMTMISRGSIEDRKASRGVFSVVAIVRHLKMAIIKR